MIKVSFHLEQLGYRGTENAVYDYADYNESYLDNISIIFAPRSGDLSTLERFLKRFPQRVYLYDKFEELQDIVDQEQIDVAYFIKAGYNDGKLFKNVKNVVHVVFNVNQPHGDKYYHVSDWLSRHSCGCINKFVPHIVTLPDIKTNYREFLNIPGDAIVFGRHGGESEFNIQYTYPVIEKVAEDNPNIYFLFMNTAKFCKDLYNVIHIDPTYDVEEKTAFINTCDAMIHAREKGESFGLAIAEFLHQNKPVICSTAGEDKNHLWMLKDKGIYYTNQNELYHHLLNLKKHNGDNRYNDLVKQYNPDDVMDLFEQRFLL